MKSESFGLAVEGNYHKNFFTDRIIYPGAFLAAAVWGGQCGGHMGGWGARILDDIIHD